MFTYFFSAFVDDAQQLGCLLLETAVAELIIVAFFCFIQATGYVAASLFLPARVWSRIENICLRANKKVHAPLPRESGADKLKRELLHNIRDCAVDPLFVILALVRAGVID